jgi:hypothetical protein
LKSVYKRIKYATYFLLMVPEEAVEGVDVGVADEGDAMARLLDALAVACDLDEEPTR